MHFTVECRYSTPLPVITLLLLFIYFFFVYFSMNTLANRLIQTRLKAVRKANSPARTRAVMTSCVSLALFRLLAALRP